MRIKPVVFFLIGGAITGVAFFAEALGLDNDAGWGKGRFVIFIFGALIIAYGIFCLFYPDWDSFVFRKIQFFTSRNIGGLLKLLQRYWYTFPVLIFVMLVYIWFVSSGSLTNWVSPTRYYAELANSFKHGKLHLLVRPSSDLLSLSNPYDPVLREREGVNFVIDYSLYNQKYYLYWGPAPAFILLLVDPFTQGKVGDLYLVFSFVGGIFLIQFLLAILIWDRFFHDLPGWILTLSILVVGLTAPWTYILINEPSGRIYEVAIAGTQCFFLIGFLVAVVAFDKPVPSSLALITTGFFWALAVGTRLVVVLPVGFMMLMIAYRIWKSTRPSAINFGVKLISLGLPVALCLVCLGWYNWARFGSITETGFSYALAGVNLQNIKNNIFSPAYIPENLYNYIFTPPASVAQFPFLYSENAHLSLSSLSEEGASNPITGLLFVVPFIVFAILPAVTLVMRTSQNTSFTLIEKNNDNSSLHWIVTSLLGVFLLNFGLLLMFFWTAMRYLGDFIPSLILLSAVGFWQGYRLFNQNPVHRKVYCVLGIIFGIAGISISTLLSISVKYFGL